MILSHAPQPLPEPALSAREFSRTLLSADQTHLGQPAQEHADAVCSILSAHGSSPELLASIPLALCRKHLTRPDEALGRSFGAPVAELSGHVATLLELASSRHLSPGTGSARIQTERARKMLLAFSRDLRAVMALLASRLEDLRFLTSHKLPAPAGFARESLEIHASLAQRLGISGIKWEMEDLAFRLLEPDTYKDIAHRLDAKRATREENISLLRSTISSALFDAKIKAEVAGRPKHIHSIVRKMRGKKLGFEQVLDIRALRVIVDDIPACYAALDVVHRLYTPDIAAFDDYIAKPKPNGYQSLHTITRDDSGHPMEIQIRTRAMHDLAENGVAAHWAYKEAGVKGYAGAVSATGSYDAKIAALRQLIDWERDLQSLDVAPVTASSKTLQSTSPPTTSMSMSAYDTAVYAFTPQANLIELRTGATPIDFAYAVHTNLGHHCRGARVDGAMVALNTPLKSGQTVEIVSAKEGGPSRDWLNPDLGYIASPRSRAKIRAWLNAADMAQTISKGRAIIEKIMAREGRASLAHDELAKSLNFPSSDELFEAAGKEALSLRSVEIALRPTITAPVSPASRAATSPLGKKAQDGVLVLGVDSLMTSLAGCCKPAPPDAIHGFVSRLKGISIHRSSCSNFRNIARAHPERLVDVQWGTQLLARPRYPVDIHIVAGDRQGLLRDIGEACAKEKTNVVGTQTRSVHGLAHMTFTVEVGSAENLAAVIARISAVDDVESATRK
jgi:GTP pyrophosphokinase